LPASESLLALTNTMTFIGCLLFLRPLAGLGGNRRPSYQGDERTERRSTSAQN
jgi:hypothetical protein